MEKQYVMVINGRVILIGGESLGLPLSEEFLTSNPNHLCFDADEFDILPDEYDWYISETHSFSKENPNPQPIDPEEELMTPDEKLTAIMEAYYGNE